MTPGQRLPGAARPVSRAGRWLHGVLFVATHCARHEHTFLGGCYTATRSLNKLPPHSLISPMTVWQKCPASILSPGKSVTADTKTMANTDWVTTRGQA